jgi:hypothetical protein
VEGLKPENNKCGKITVAGKDKKMLGIQENKRK